MMCFDIFKRVLSIMFFLFSFFSALILFFIVWRVIDGVRLRLYSRRVYEHVSMHLAVQYGQFDFRSFVIYVMYAAKANCKPF